MHVPWVGGDDGTNTAQYLELLFGDNSRCCNGAIIDAQTTACCTSGASEASFARDPVSHCYIYMCVPGFPYAGVRVPPRACGYFCALAYVRSPKSTVLAATATAKGIRPPNACALIHPMYDCALIPCLHCNCLVISEQGVLWRKLPREAARNPLLQRSGQHRSYYLR